MNETEFSEGRTTADPETDEAAALAARATEDEATDVALQEAGGPRPDTDAPAADHDLTAPVDQSPEPVQALEREAHVEEADDVPEAAVEETTLDDAGAEMEVTEPQVETEVDTPVPSGSFDAVDDYVEQGQEREAPPAEEAPPPEAEGEAEGVLEPEAEPEPQVAADTEPDEPEAVVVVEEAGLAPSPFGGPGDWYVIHTYAGYENKVKANLHSRISSMQMEEKIFDVVIPMEDVMEIKGGKK
jgi:transcriptional antiterminator NusG